MSVDPVISKKKFRRVLGDVETFINQGDPIIDPKLGTFAGKTSIPTKKPFYVPPALGLSDKHLKGLSQSIALPGEKNSPFKSMTGTGNVTAATTTVPPTNTGSKFSEIVGKAGQVANTLAPYASNIINAFRKAPMPKKGVPYTHTPLSKVDMSNERYAVTSNTRAADRSAERNIDNNTAEAVKAFNRGEEFSKLSAINERETNINVGISNQQAQMEAQVKGLNTGLENKFQDEVVQRNIAQQREQSANIANAGDKAMMIKNEKAKGETEIAKARVLSDLYSRSGVLDRERRRLKAAGEPDPMGKGYKDLDNLAYGGQMKLPKKKLC